MGLINRMRLYEISLVPGLKALGMVGVMERGERYNGFLWDIIGPEIRGPQRSNLWLHPKWHHIPFML
jgi:hypothetical protein